MSDWGFKREPSPAMRKARRLTNLVIDEVSSVDRGAGRGVKVLLTKRDNERNDHMNTQSSIGALSICKRAQQAANEGRLSQFALNELMQEVSNCFFGGSISKMLETDSMGRAANEFGAVFMAPRARTSAAEQARLQKMEGYWKRPRAASGGMPHEFNEKPGEASRDQLSENLNTATKTDVAIKAHQANGCSYDEAVTRVLRSQRGY